VSVGAALHDGHPDFLRMMKAADDALYEAKNTGRNRVVIAKQIATTYGQLENLLL
jgi:diguanylate cyclase